MLPEPLEPRRLLAFAVNVDFSTPSAPVVSGTVKDIGDVYANRNGLTYGWNTDNRGGARDRNATSDQRYDTITHTQLYGSRSWDIAVPNGTYRVRLVAGDPSTTDSDYRFSVEGALASGTPTGGSRFVDRVVTVNVTDGKLSINNAGGAVNNKLAFVEIAQQGSTPSSNQSPFGGTPIGLSGRIQAENFDEGGQGVAYSDSDTANKGGAYRSTAVDLYDQNGVKFVGATRAGEWLEYTVNVAQSGTYTLEFVVASGNGGGTFHIDVDGQNKTGAINLPGTGGWNTFRTVTKTGVGLTAGTHVLRLSFDAAASSGQDIGNVDSINAYRSDVGTPPPTPPPSPGLATWPASWTQVANSPQPRFEAYGFSRGNNLFIFGGFNDSSFKGITRTDRFNPASGQWSYLGEMKAPETHAGVAVDESNGYAYFVNGYRGAYPATPTKEVWRYDIDNNSWLRLPDYPVVGGAGNAALINGKLHYFGGSEPDRVTNSALHYALDLNNLSAGWQQKASQPLARDHQSAVVRNGEIYVVGGEFGHDRDKLHQKIFQKYNPGSNSWSRLADAPVAKSHAEHSVFVHNNKLIFAGGQTYPDQSGTSNVIAYDFGSGSWSYLKNLPAARQGAVVERVGDVVVIANGGVTTYQPQRTIWIGRLT